MEILRTYREQQKVKNEYIIPTGEAHRWAVSFTVLSIVSSGNSRKLQTNRNARKPHEYTVSGLFYWSE